jgi:hypothetical protein
LKLSFQLGATRWRPRPVMILPPEHTRLRKMLMNMIVRPRN